MTLSVSELPHVLVIDDSAGCRRTLDQLLSPYVKVTLAEGVPEALAALDSSVRLVLSDVLMPGESGLDLARSLHRTHPDLPVVLFTGIIDLELRTHAREVGVIDVLRKPLKAINWPQLLARWLGPEVLAAQPATASAPTGSTSTPHLPAPQPEPQPKPAAHVPADPLEPLSQQAGVLSVAHFAADGTIQRSLKLPFPAELGPQVVSLWQAYQATAHALGTTLAAGHVASFPFADRVLVLALAPNSEWIGVLSRPESSQKVADFLGKS